jgi:hypothetical protein
MFIHRGHLKRVVSIEVLEKYDFNHLFSNALVSMHPLMLLAHSYLRLDAARSEYAVGAGRPSLCFSRVRRIDTVLSARLAILCLGACCSCNVRAAPTLLQRAQRGLVLLLTAFQAFPCAGMNGSRANGHVKRSASAR